MYIIIKAEPSELSGFQPDSILDPIIELHCRQMQAFGEESDVSTVCKHLFSVQISCVLSQRWILIVICLGAL